MINQLVHFVIPKRQPARGCLLQPEAMNHRNGISTFHSWWILAALLPAVAACAASPKSPTWSVVFFPDDVRDAEVSPPPLKQVACQYTAQVIALCEVHVANRPEIPPDFDTSDERAVLDLVSRSSRPVDDAVARSAPMYMMACMDMAMSPRQAAQRLMCIEAAGDCHRVHHCFGDEYKRGDPAKEREVRYKFRANP